MTLYSLLNQWDTHKPKIIRGAGVSTPAGDSKGAAPLWPPEAENHSPIEFRLREHDDHRCWRTIRDILSTHQRVTIAFNDAGGRHHSLRVNTTPEGEQREIHDRLAIPRALFPQRHHYAAQGPLKQNTS